MEVFIAAFLGAATGVAVTLGGVNVLTTLVTIFEGRKQIEQLRLAIDNARKAGVPISHDIKN